MFLLEELGPMWGTIVCVEVLSRPTGNGQHCGSTFCCCYANCGQNVIESEPPWNKNGANDAHQTKKMYMYKKQPTSFIVIAMNANTL